MRKLLVIFLMIMVSGCAAVNSMTETASNLLTKKEIKYYQECYEYIDKIDAKYSDKGLSAAVKGALIGRTIGALQEQFQAIIKLQKLQEQQALELVLRLHILMFGIKDILLAIQKKDFCPI